MNTSIDEIIETRINDLIDGRIQSMINDAVYRHLTRPAMAKEFYTLVRQALDDMRTTTGVFNMAIENVLKQEIKATLSNQLNIKLEIKPKE